MIISPNALITVNVLHAVNNSYKCTEQVYMLSRSTDDCNLYLRKLYWERDPNDTYIPPDFSQPKQSILLIRYDLISADCSVPCTPPNSANIVNRDFEIQNQDGYTIGGEIVEIGIKDTVSNSVLPLLYPSAARNSHELSWLRLTCPYVRSRSLQLCNSADTAITSANLNDFSIRTAHVQRLQFGEERKVCTVLCYKPAASIVQLLTLPQSSDSYELVFDDRTAKDYREPLESTVPCFVNLDHPVSVKELFLRWTGTLSHIQLLDVPVIRSERWELADEASFDWEFLMENSTYVPVSEDDEPDITTEYKFTGDLSTGILFEHPLADRDAKVTDSHYKSAVNPYKGLNYYSSFETAPDIWELQGFRLDIIPNQYNANLDEHIVPQDDDGTERSWVIRPTDDNRAYMANKSLLRGYYTWETGGWRSNHGQPSTPNQLRFLVTFPQVQFIRGCFNPVSNVAVTAGKPHFYREDDVYKFEPGLYGDYLVPWRVLIEGRPDLKFKTKFQLIDEYTLEHFRTDTHTHFSYQVPVKQIRITVQDWYGTTLLDDLKDDYIYMKGNWHYGEYSALEPHACDVVCGRSTDNVGTFLRDPDPVYDSLRAEWDLWKRRTIQSIWKGIYIPPFVFF